MPNDTASGPSAGNRMLNGPGPRGGAGRPGTGAVRAILAAAVLAGLAASCTPMRWVDMRTGDPAGAEAALEECRQSARQESWRAQWLHGWPPPFYHPYPKYPGWHRPFWLGRPWNDDLYFYLTDFCMRSKGFRLVPVPEGEAKP